MNWQATTGTELMMAGLVESELKARAVPSTGEAGGDWLCAWCLNRVAHERDRFRFDGQEEFTFTNPAGYRFEIVLFSQTRGCRQSGEPTLEHTWFPGHAWFFCQCARCGEHLGWYYAGPQEFVGLIKPRIVRALFVRN